VKEGGGGEVPRRADLHPPLSPYWELDGQDQPNQLFPAPQKPDPICCKLQTIIFGLFDTIFRHLSKKNQQLNKAAKYATVPVTICL
jgi:hypothetical protein